jgi:tetratricopeptide (TPR) repeat protein
MPFDEAAAEYRLRIMKGEADAELALEAAEFLLFSGRGNELEELESRLLAPELCSADTMALCAYNRSEKSIPAGIELIREAKRRFPRNDRLLNDFLRLQALGGDIEKLLPGEENGAGIESWDFVAGSIYLLLFLTVNEFITDLPDETAPAIELLHSLASGRLEERDALFLEADYAAVQENPQAERAAIKRALEIFPDDYEVLFSAARLGLKTDFTAEPFSPGSCLEYAERARSLRPLQGDADRLKAKLYMTVADDSLAAGREKEAHQELLMAVEAFEASHRLDSRERRVPEEFLLALGTLYTASDDPAEQEEICRRADLLIRELPEEFYLNPVHLAEIGRSLFENGLEKEGNTLIRRAVQIDPEAPEVQHASGTVAFTRGIRSEGQDDQQRLLASALRRFTKAYEKEKDPGQKGRYLVTMASVYREQHDDTGELTVLRQGMETGLPDEEIYLLISEIYHRKGAVALAVEALERGFELLPRSADLGIETARCYSRDGRFEEAVQTVDTLLRIYPNTPWIWNQMGIINIEWGGTLPDGSEEQTRLFTKAADAYDQARHMDPKEFTYRGNYGDVLRLLGRIDEAEEHLKASLKLNSADIFSLNSLGLLYGERAKKESSKEKQEAWLMEAERCLQHASDLDPSNPAFEVNLADLYYDFGYFEDTIDIYQRIIETVEDAWQYYDIIGLCYYHTGNLQEASRWFSAAMEKEPQAPEVVNSLGLCCFGAGKVNEAIEYFKQASLLDPENPVYLDNIVMAQYNQKGYPTDYGDGPRM